MNLGLVLAIHNFWFRSEQWKRMFHIQYPSLYKPTLKDSTVFQRKKNYVSFILTVEVKLNLDLPNCWHLYKLLIYIYIFNFRLFLDHLYSTGKLWFLQKQLHSTTHSRKTEIYTWGLEDMATESVIPFGGSKNHFYIAIICTDQGT